MYPAAAGKNWICQSATEGTFGLLLPWTLAEIELRPNDSLPEARVTALGPVCFWKAI